MSQRILILEDESVIALEIDNAISGAGYATEVAASVSAALAKITTGAFDGAILDANVRGERVDSVALALQERNIPFLFVSGYGREGLPSSCPEAPLVPKPFHPTQLLSAVGNIVRRPAAVESNRPYRPE
jgi:DNA-binding response OmpR family regulator